MVGWVCSVTDETTGGVRLPTWCDSTDLYLRECSITLRGVKGKRRGGSEVKVRTLDRPGKPICQSDEPL